MRGGPYGLRGSTVNDTVWFAAVAPVSQTRKFLPTKLEGEPMRVVVDYDLCEGNAVCMGLMPEVFDVRDDGFLYLLNETPPDDLRPKLEQAVRLCPKQAITIGDD
jgi:ferredoxin